MRPVKNVSSENKSRMSNYGFYSMSSGGPNSFPRDPRTGQAVFNNQPSGIINDKPPSSGNCADVPTNSKKKSIVITNSKLSSASQSQPSLCNVEFQNKISLALPPGITWEEINAPPPTSQQIEHILHYTYQLNSQLKKKKKRMRNYRNDSMSMDPRSQQYKYTKSGPSVPTRNQSAKSFSCEKAGPFPSTNKISPKASVTVANSKDEKESGIQGKVEPTPEVALSSSQEDVEPVVISKTVEIADVNIKHKYSSDEILKLRQPEITNVEVVEAVKRHVIFRDPSLPDTPSSSRNRNSEAKPPDLKELMRLSWAGSDDGREAETSKQIFENIRHQAESLDATTTDFPAKKNKKKKHLNEVLDAMMMDVLKSGTKKKKKKPKETANQSEQTKATEEIVEVFDDYYDDLTVQEGLKNGTMYQETLRINGKNWRVAFISCSMDNKDIFIDGLKNRNRALDGDEVVVELLPEKPTNTSEDGTPKTTPQKCGKVVRIVKENHPRTAVGPLKPVYTKKQMSVFHFPLDPRLPRIKITHSECLPLVKLRPQLHTLKENVVFLAKITKWESVKNAEGTLVKEIGDTEDPSVESQCILYENNLDVTPFKSSDESIPSLPYEIPDEEISRRLDIRNSCVFTIDPPGAKDLDDALSCRVLPNNNIEVGIHIADVTHFLLSDTPLDLNAREKATSIYLTETVYHMLPFELCQLCSLTPGADKLAFSAFVEFDEEANVISHSFSKTVLRTCVQLTYAHAQDVIENYSESYEPKSFPPVVNGFSANDCVLNIRMLQKLASKMRKRRFDGGALKIDKPKLVFDLDEDRLPCSFSLYMGQECNWLIEEFMLLANSLVAAKILESFPETALLRSHNSPIEKSLTSAVEYLEKVGIFIDTTDAGSIYKSMMQYDGLGEIGMARMAVIMNLLIKPMVKALYVCSSDTTDHSTGFWHYALNTPCYTHFTSPIRRYADVVVHRLLAASIGLSEAPPLSSNDVEVIANNCNTKKNSSKKAQETSAELYLKLYLERCGPLKVRAVVIDVKERHYFEVMDLTTRTAGRILINKIRGTEKVEYENEGMPSVRITWKNEPELLEQIIQIFTIVDVELSYKKNSGHRLLNKIHVELLKPVL